MAGNMGTPTTENPSQPLGAMSSGQGMSTDTAPQFQAMNQSNMPSAGGDKGSGVGAMQPQASGVGSPSNYGGSLPNMNESNNYANGTMSVAGYEDGTTGLNEDPWNWTKKEQVAPLVASIKPSEIVVPQAVPDQTEQFLGNQATAMGTNAAAKGIDAAYKAYNAPLTTNAISTMGTTASGAPVALTNAGAMAAPAAEGMYALSAPSMGGAGLGATASTVAPLGAGIGASLPAVAAEGAGIAAAGSGAAATGAAMAGGEAALAAMGPVGMVIGGALLAKKLGIF